MSLIRHRKQRGLSLLEILLAIILLSMVIMATATVYPGGYKLNASNKSASQATTIAQGILEEIKMRPFTEVIVGADSEGYEYFSIEEIAKNYRTDPVTNIYTKYEWPFHDHRFSTDEWKYNCPVLCWYNTPNPDINAIITALRTNRKSFFLAPYSNTIGVPPGIVVRGYGDGDDDPNDSDWQPIAWPDVVSPHMVKVQVSVSWIEYRNKQPIGRSVTLSSWVTQNKNE